MDEGARASGGMNSNLCNSENVHVALAANHRYLPGLLATVASLALSSKQKDRIALHVFADGLSEEDCEEVSKISSKYGLTHPIDFIHPDMEPLRKLFAPYKGSHATFFRIYLCEFRLGFARRFLFLMMSLVYPYRPLVELMTLPFNLHRTDNIHRTLFFAWLRKRLPEFCK